MDVVASNVTGHLSFCPSVCPPPPPLTASYIAVSGRRVWDALVRCRTGSSHSQQPNNAVLLWRHARRIRLGAVGGARNSFATRHGMSRQYVICDDYDRGEHTTHCYPWPSDPRPTWRMTHVTYDLRPTRPMNCWSMTHTTGAKVLTSNVLWTFTDVL